MVKHVIHIYENEQGEKVEPEVDLPDGIYGKRFQAFVTLLRGVCGASHEKIAEIVQGIRPDLSFSPTTSLNITDKISKNLEENTLSCMETWKLQDKNVFQKLQRFTS